MRISTLALAIAALAGCEATTYCDGAPEPCSEWIDVYVVDELGDPADIEEITYLRPTDEADSLTYCDDGWCQIPYDTAGQYTFTVQAAGIIYTLTTTVDPTLNALGACCNGPIIIDEIELHIRG